MHLTDFAILKSRLSNSICSTKCFINSERCSLIYTLLLAKCIYFSVKCLLTYFSFYKVYIIKEINPIFLKYFWFAISFLAISIIILVAYISSNQSYKNQLLKILIIVLKRLVCYAHFVKIIIGFLLAYISGKISK